MTITKAVPKSLVECAEQPEHLGAGLAVEVAGRLVGEHEGWAHDKRARQRDALPLSTREVVRRVRRAVGQTDLGEQRAGALHHLVVAAAAIGEQRQHHVLLRRERRQEMVELEDESDATSAQRGQRRVVHGGDVPPLKREHGRWWHGRAIR